MFKQNGGLNNYFFVSAIGSWCLLPHMRQNPSFPDICYPLGLMVHCDVPPVTENLQAEKRCTGCHTGVPGATQAQGSPPPSKSRSSVGGNNTFFLPHTITEFYPQPRHTIRHPRPRRRQRSCLTVLSARSNCRQSSQGVGYFWT